MRGKPKAELEKGATLRSLRGRLFNSAPLGYRLSRTVLAPVSGGEDSAPLRDQSGKSLQSAVSPQLPVSRVDVRLKGFSHASTSAFL